MNKLLIFFQIPEPLSVIFTGKRRGWNGRQRLIDNGVTGRREECLGMLRKIAHAQTLDDYKEALKDFQSSQLFQKNEKLSRWFSNTWLPEAEVCTVSSEVTVLDLF